MENKLDYNKIQAVIELYRSVQMEGGKTGIPHIILRTTGCSHRCFFGEGGWCDSFTTSIHPEKGIYNLNQIKEFFIQNKDINHLMITGGSPTMHPKLVNELVNMFHKIHDEIYDRDIYQRCFITIETEGSHFVKTDIKIDLVSMSPKFSNSIPILGIEKPLGGIVDEKFIKQHNKLRLNKQAIIEMITYHKDYQIKPVVNPIQQSNIWNEVVKFLEDMSIEKNKVWIMPPGDSKEEILKSMGEVITFCTDNGYNYSGRDHIIAFGNTRYK